MTWLCEWCGARTDEPTHVLSADRRTEATFCPACKPDRSVIIEVLAHGVDNTLEPDAPDAFEALS